MYYEGPLRISKTEGLSADEAEVEARFAELVQTHLDDMVAQYGERFGRVINTDQARELSPDYCASNLSRTRYSRAVYQPAKALADEIYRREILKGSPPEAWRILFMSGGPGAGKSTVLAWFSKGPQTDDDYDIIVDGTLSDHQAAQAKIQGALSLGHRVVVVHVFRPLSIQCGLP